MAENDKDLLAQAKDDHEEAKELWAENQKLWLEDAHFRAGDHWPAKIKKEREDAGRPVVVVDKTEQHVRQVVNDGRQNRPAPKVSPVDSKADPETAKAFKGIIRSICNKSNADEAIDTALDHAAGCGFGFMRVITEHEHDRTFHQEIKVRRVRNPLTVLLGPHQLADGSDARYGFFVEEVPKKLFKKKWPKAKVTNWESEAFREGWSSETHVRVCEYFYIEDELTDLHLLDDDTTATAEEYEKDTRPVRTSPEEPGDLKPAIVDTRSMPTPRVKWCRLTAGEILEKNDWLGKYIPIIPVYGVERDINGKVTYSGLIRPAKDAQRLYDFARAGFAEHVSLSTRVPWIAAEGQLEGQEDAWERSNTENIMVLTYKPVSLDGTPVPPPSRIAGSGIPAGLAQDMQISEHDIQGSMGQYNPSLGAKGNATSGVQERAQIKEGDTGTYHYHDNLNRAIRYLCRILVDLAPKIIDSRRAIRMLGEDGVVSMAVADPQQSRSYLKPAKRGAQAIYNLSLGTYDVDVEAGPSYTTKRQEASEGMLSMAQADPTMWRTHGDLIAQMQDWPMSEEFAKRSRLTLPPEIRQAVDAEEGGEESPEVAALKAQAQQMLDQASQQIQAAEQGIAERDQAMKQLQDEVAALKRDQELKARELGIKEYEAETERLQVLAPATAPEQVQAIVHQTVQEIMAQPVPEPPLMQPQPDQPPDGGFFTPEGM